MIIIKKKQWNETKKAITIQDKTWFMDEMKWIPVLIEIEINEERFPFVFPGGFFFFFFSVLFTIHEVIHGSDQYLLQSTSTNGV